MAVSNLRTDDDVVDDWEVDKEFADVDNEDEFLKNNKIEGLVSGNCEADADDRKKRKRAKLEMLKSNKLAKKEKMEETASKMSVQDQASLIWRYYLKYYGNDLTDLQVDDSFKGQHFCQGPSFPDQKIGNLCKLIQHIFPKWKNEFKRTSVSVFGSPLVLVVSLSARRSVELLKGLRDFKCHVAKLFSKHLKIEDQVSSLKQYYPLGVGTPNRLKKLISVGALSLDATKYIVIDMQKDAKNYTILELADSSKDLMDLIHTFLKHPVLRGDMKIALY